jgi:2-amino-4-hydroxy-6-hydroxymethyldihydropteridine diphosphokinase
MIVLGLGANMESRWGSPTHTVQHVVSLFGAYGVFVKARSPLYASAPLGVRVQADYVNAVVTARTALPPGALLGVLKRIEREAGRRGGVRWGPRPLDIDILDYAGRVLNWPAPKPVALMPRTRRRAPRHPTATPRTGGRAPLVLPHPQLHLREFVLAPLADVAPRWHHPVTGEPVARLLDGLRASGAEREGRVLEILPGGLT